MSVTTRKFQGKLIVRLEGGQTFDLRRPTGRCLIRVTMGDDEASVTLETLALTTHETSEDLGNTGWASESTAAGEVDRGLDHDIRPSVKDDIRGAREGKRGTRGRRNRR